MKAQEFQAELAREGFTDPEAGEYEPGRVNPDHTHPFEVRGLIVSGEMAITPARGPSRNYGPGEVFVMPLGQTHSESVGPDGVRYLYGQRPA